MEASIAQICASPVFTPKLGLFSRPNFVSIPNRNQQKNRVLRCAKEKILTENELNMEEELIGMKKLNENCKGIGGIEELMECLEKEAIMGEDEGIHPNDYNRRAIIFDKSSKLFQAIKQQQQQQQIDSPPPPPL